MKGHRLLVAGFAISLLTVSPATSAVKAGGACKSVGKIAVSKGKSFVCVKFSGKMIWRSSKTTSNATKVRITPSPATPTTATPAPSPLTSPSPTPTPVPTLVQKPNPFASPFPDDFNRGDMTSAVIKSFQEYVASNSSPKSYKLVIGPEFENSGEEIKKFVDRAYAALPFPKDYQKTIIVVSRNGELGEREIKEFGFDRSDANKAVGGPCMNCAGEGWATSDNGLGAVTPHELFHVWQKSAYKRKGNNNPDPNNPLNPPVWFDEGSADFFGYLIYRERSNFYEGVGPYRDFQPLKKYSTRDLDPGLPYLLGRVASEYIVASVGMERFLQIFFNVGEGLDFPRAFEKATGVTLDFFYEKFDKNIRKMF